MFKEPSFVVAPTKAHVVLLNIHFKHFKIYTNEDTVVTIIFDF